MFNATAAARKLVNVTKAVDQNNVATPAVESPYIAGQADTGATFHNSGATGSSTVMLPSGAQYEDHFMALEVTAQGIVFDPTSLNGGASGTNVTGQIVDGASSTTVGVGVYTSSSQGAYVELVCIGAGPVWQVVHKQGTWTCT